MKKHHVITFSAPNDALAVALAKCGFGNALIISKTNLTDSQITYRLSKHKRVRNDKFGYRVGYRTGKSDLSQQVIVDIAAILQHQIQEQTPKFVLTEA